MSNSNDYATGGNVIHPVPNLRQLTNPQRGGGSLKILLPALLSMLVLAATYALLLCIFSLFAPLVLSTFVIVGLLTPVSLLLLVGALLEVL